MLPLQVRYIEPPHPPPGAENTDNVQARRISTLFALSQHWKTHDVFLRQKLSTFRSSRPAVLELALQYQALATQLDRDTTTTTTRSPTDPAQAAKTLFLETAEISLWGNATDLSLLTSLTYADIQTLQAPSARKAAESTILANDLPAAYDVLATAAAQRSPARDRRVDIVLDNAGFELFVDLLLAAHLLATGLASSVVLHPKSIPWFVSDVVPADFAALLNALADPRAFYAARSPDDDDDSDAGKRGASEPLSSVELDALAFFFRQLTTFHADGRLRIRSNRFWTHAGSYWRLPATEPGLFADLREAELVVFKGDLNYRKLVGDVRRSFSFPFLALFPASPSFPCSQLSPYFHVVRLARKFLMNLGRVTTRFLCPDR